MTKIRTVEDLNTTIKDYEARVENINAIVHGEPAVNCTKGWQSAKDVRLHTELSRARQDMAEITEIIEFVKLLRLASEMDFSFLDKHSALMSVSDDTMKNIGIYTKLANLCKAWDNNSDEDIIALGRYANRRNAEENAYDSMHR